MGGRDRGSFQTKATLLGTQPRSRALRQKDACGICFWTPLQWLAHPSGVSCPLQRPSSSQYIVLLVSGKVSFSENKAESQFSLSAFACRFPVPSGPFWGGIRNVFFPGPTRLLNRAEPVRSLYG